MNQPVKQHSTFKDNPSNRKNVSSHTKGNSVEPVGGTSSRKSVPDSFVRAQAPNKRSGEREEQSQLCSVAPVPSFSIRAHIISLLKNELRSRADGRPFDTTIKHPKKIEIYGEGVRFTGMKIGGKNDQSGKHKRGKIAGWSKSSRRRMREVLLTHCIPSNWEAFGLTFTIPGYNLPPETAKRIFQNWKVRANRMGICAIWRIELQKRGQLHWHAIAGMKCECPEIGALLLKKSWHMALRSVGEIEYQHIGDKLNPQKMDYITGKQNLMAWPGAELFSADIDILKDREGAIKRYIQDHATKTKQEQIPEDIGRHWGILNAKAFSKPFPDQVMIMTNEEYARFLRAYNRLCTTSSIPASCVFGRKQGFKGKRGRYGKTVYFSRPETVKRLADWSMNKVDKIHG